MRNKIDLIGDGIENHYNALAMIDIANTFGAKCLFRDRKKLEETIINSELEHNAAFISCEQVAESYSSVVALDNLPGAADLYGFKIPTGIQAAIIAGNERHGISHDMQKTANSVVQIPMFGGKLNTLNVAAASGVALYYLSAALGGKLQSRNRPETRRPDILFIGSKDHIELGSAIRSAGAFGWNRLFLEDRHNVWFGCDRATRSEGRGAARRGRNSIRLLSVQSDKRYAFRNVTVVSTTDGIPLHKANLAIGPQQLLVLPDENDVVVAKEDWERLGNVVQLVKIDVPSDNYAYHYRLFASIALAEAARQIGQRPSARIVRPDKQGPVYESSLSILLDERGDEIFLEDLEDY